MKTVQKIKCKRKDYKHFCIEIVMFFSPLLDFCPVYACFTIIDSTMCPNFLHMSSADSAI